MRIALFGSGPWPLEPDAQVTGPSIRLRQFAQPLIAAGHEVHVVLLEEGFRADVPIDGASSATALTVAMEDPVSVLAQVPLHDCECVIGVGSLLPVVAAVRLAKHLDVSCHADFFGDPLAELHALQTAPEEPMDAEARDHIWKLYREALIGADHWSTVSSPEKHALIGQLGLLGQFGQHPDFAHLISPVPCAVPESWLDKPIRPAFPEYLKELGLESGTPWVLFSGSWNAWLDIDAIADTVALAMEANSELYFVIKGIPTHDAGARLQHQLLETLGSFSKRIIVVAPEVDLPEAHLLAHAPASICLDRDIPESWLGDRNRLLAQIRWGVRPVVSRHAEVCRKLHRADLADAVKANDPTAALSVLLSAATRSREDREKATESAREWLKSYTFSKTLKPVLEWVGAAAPRRTAPNYGGQLDQWNQWLPERDITPEGKPGLFGFLKRK